uniref:Uncharacterized protein n=1 Tax=Myotis myotis TaxID=51298 RepID=A0A7J7UPR6_MYOMY|nr:hypothetical protein mMyoMyo1_008544 [Myotis myotis]
MWTPGASPQELSAQLSLQLCQPGLSGLPQNSSRDGEKRPPEWGDSARAGRLGRTWRSIPESNPEDPEPAQPAHVRDSRAAGGVQQRIPPGGEARSLQGPRGRSSPHWLSNVTSHSGRRTQPRGSPG